MSLRKRCILGKHSKQEIFKIGGPIVLGLAGASLLGFMADTGGASAVIDQLLITRARQAIITRDEDLTYLGITQKLLKTAPSLARMHDALNAQIAHLTMDNPLQIPNPALLEALWNRTEIQNAYLNLHSLSAQDKDPIISRYGLDPLPMGPLTAEYEAHMRERAFAALVQTRDQLTRFSHDLVQHLIASKRMMTGIESDEDFIARAPPLINPFLQHYEQHPNPANKQALIQVLAENDRFRESLLDNVPNLDQLKPTLQSPEQMLQILNLFEINQDNHNLTISHYRFFKIDGPNNILSLSPNPLFYELTEDLSLNNPWRSLFNPIEEGLQSASSSSSLTMSSSSSGYFGDLSSLSSGTRSRRSSSLESL